MTRTRTEVMPTANDRKHITPLAQMLLDSAQNYARENNMTLPGVMSAIGTMSGAILARAYKDKATAKDVADRIGIVALEMIELMHKHDVMILTRDHKGSA